VATGINYAAAQRGGVSGGGGGKSRHGAKSYCLLTARSNLPSSGIALILA